MSIFTTLFNEVLFRPFLNILVVFYNLSGDFGIAIILLTILVRLILYPFSAKAIKSQQELSQLQPQVQEIQKRYHNNQAEQSKELMRLYREHKVNPFAGCLPILIQLPVFFALFEALRRGLDPGQLSNLYSFVHHPAQISPLLLGFLDLKTRSIWLAFFAALLQLIQSRLSLPKSGSLAGKEQGGFAAAINQQMIYTLPIVIFLVSITLPAGIALYIAISTAFSLIQQLLTKPKPVGHTHQQ